MLVITPKILLAHRNIIQILCIIFLVTSIPILSYQKLDAQPIDNSILHSKIYETIANRTTALEDTTASINVGILPEVMVLDSNSFYPNRIYVANWGSNTISVIDANNNTNIATVKVGQSPVGQSPDNSIISRSSSHFPPFGLTAMAVNNGKIYINSFPSDSISIIDGKNYSNVRTIKVRNGIHSVDNWPPWGGGGFFMPIKIPNYVYVASSGSRNVTIIDGSNNNNANIMNVTLKKAPLAMTLLSPIDDPTGTSRPRIVVIDRNPTNTISVINRNNYTNIHVPMGYHFMANSLNKILVSNYGNNNFIDKKYNNTISIIDGTNYSDVRTIKVGNTPVFIYSPSKNNILQSNDKRIFVSNYVDGTVSVIDGKNYSDVRTIKVGNGPYYITKGSLDKIYVANYIDGTVSVIDGKNYSDVRTIKVGNGPYYMISNPSTNTIYVSNVLSNSVSIIDGVSNKVVAGVTFNVNPVNSGDIVCNNLTIPTPLNQHFYIFSGSKCTAKPHKGFEFQSWQENLKGNSTQSVKSSNLSPSTIYDYVAGFSDSTQRFFGIKPYLDDISRNLGIKSSEDEKALGIAKFGSFTANFKALPPPIPTEYITTLFGIVAAAFVSSWLTPTVIGWRKTRNQAKKLGFYRDKLYNLYQDGKLDRQDIGELDKLRNKIVVEYTTGKMNKEQYDKLLEDISMKYTEIYRKELDSLNNLSETEKETKSNDIQKNLEDIHSKGIISNEQFTLLRNKISVQYEEIFKKRINSLKPSEKDVKEKLKDIESAIEDAYSSGKLTELHYNLLNKRITEYKI